MKKLLLPIFGMLMQGIVVTLMCTSLIVQGSGIYSFGNAMGPFLQWGIACVSLVLIMAGGFLICIGRASMAGALIFVLAEAVVLSVYPLRGAQYFSAVTLVNERELLLDDLKSGPREQTMPLHEAANGVED